MNQLKSVQFSSTLKSIGNGAFYNSGLEEITFPDSLEVIYENAFEGSLQLKNIVFNKDQSQLKILHRNAFRNCKSLETIQLPHSLEELRQQTFEGCAQLTSIQFGKNLNLLGSGCFTKCSKLGSIEIDVANPYFKTDEDSVIYTNDGKELVYYPFAKNEKEYIVKEGIERI